MPALEEEKKMLTGQMSVGNLSFDDLSKLSDRMLEITQLLEKKEMRWLELSDML